jgi:hypothetical protein
VIYGSQAPEDDVVAAAVHEQAASVTPGTSNLDKSGQALVDAGAYAAEVDVAALLKQLQALEAKVQAAIPDPLPPAPPARTSSLVADGSPGWLGDIFRQLEDRVDALEIKAGLKEAPEEDAGKS